MRYKTHLVALATLLLSVGTANAQFGITTCGPSGCTGGGLTGSDAQGSSGAVQTSDGFGVLSDSGCTVLSAINGAPEMSCGAFTSIDQNSIGGGFANKSSVYGNDSNSVSGATCATGGVDGDLVTMDADNSTGHTWVMCNGSNEINRLANPNFMLLPNSGVFSMDSGVLVVGSANMTCGPFIPTYTLENATKLAFNVSTLDATNTKLNVCIFDSAKNLIMATSRCVGGTAAGAPCDDNDPCTGGGTCTSADATNTGVESATGLTPVTFVQNKLYYICTTGNSPATSQITTARNGGNDSAIINAYITHQGTIANTASGNCPLTFGALSAAQVEVPQAIVSAE